MITKLGMVVTYREGVHPQSHLIISVLQDHLINYNHYTSTTTQPMPQNLAG